MVVVSSLVGYNGLSAQTSLLLSPVSEEEIIISVVFVGGGAWEDVVRGGRARGGEGGQLTGEE